MGHQLNVCIIAKPVRKDSEINHKNKVKSEIHLLEQNKRNFQKMIQLN